MEDKQRKYLPTIAQLIDRLSIVTLKSIKISENKKEYEKEAWEIIDDLNGLLGDTLGKNKGRFVRAVQINAIVNEMIWHNEAFVRKGEGNISKEEIADRLQLTHAMNRIRNQAMNILSDVTGERKDLKLDYMDAELTKKFGYDFSDLFEKID